MSVTTVGVVNLARTTIGKKVIMAVTGIIGIGFVIMHMYGNLKVFVGAEYFNAYAEGLRSLGAPVFGHGHLLWATRLVLLGAVWLHAWAAWSLYQNSKQARAVSYLRHGYVQANPAALYIRVGGVILFLFIIFHILHFTIGLAGIHPDFRDGDVYRNVIVGFQSYAYLPAIFYLVAMIALGFHLFHGVYSLFQTLGMNDRRLAQSLKSLGLMVALVVAGGFAIVPLAVLLGLVR
jgi:succinate dehydrogenase / fumarate reductase cytochrome b subunit